MVPLLTPKNCVARIARRADFVGIEGMTRTGNPESGDQAGDRRRWTRGLEALQATGVVFGPPGIQMEEIASLCASTQVREGVSDLTPAVLSYQAA